MDGDAKVAEIGRASKKWDELTTEEKLETLRYEIRESRHISSRMYRLENKIRRLFKHSHSDKGEVVCPMEFHDDESSCGVASRLDRLA